MNPDGPILEDADRQLAEAAEHERNGTLHSHGSRLAGDLDPDAGVLDEVVYQAREYPFQAGARLRINRSMTPGNDRVTMTVIGADDRKRGHLTVFKEGPSGALDVEINALSLEDLGDLETSLQTLRPRDVLPETE